MRNAPEHRAINVTIGRNIRMRRSLAGLSQPAVSEQLGVTYQQLHKYERAINRMPAGRLPRLAEILGCRVEDFFLGLDDIEPANERLVTLMQDAAAMPEHKRATLCAMVRAMAGESDAR